MPRERSSHLETAIAQAQAMGLGRSALKALPTFMAKCEREYLEALPNKKRRLLRPHRARAYKDAVRLVTSLRALNRSTQDADLEQQVQAFAKTLKSEMEADVGDLRVTRSPLVRLVAEVRDFVVANGGVFARNFDDDGKAQSQAAVLVVSIARWIDPKITDSQCENAMKRVQREVRAGI